MADIVVTLTPTRRVSATLASATLASGSKTLALVVGDSEVEARLAPFMRGARGPAGDSATTFTQTFSSPAASWVVNHNLGREANVQVLSVGGVEVEANVVHVSSNQAIVYFSSAQTGRVRCV